MEGDDTRRASPSSVDLTSQDDASTIAQSDSSTGCLGMERSSKRKKRVSTYQARKDEKESLEEQIAMLQRQLAELEGPQKDESFDVRRSIIQNARLASKLEVSFITMAGAQSMMSAFTNSNWQSPLSNFIHLTTDPTQRRECLEALYDRKMDLATKFILERTRFLDLRRDHCHTESGELASGEFTFTRFDVTPFGRHVSTREVFDELRRYLGHMEISITDSLGLLTVIDAEDALDSNIRQIRYSSKFDDSLETEANQVNFFKFVETGDDSYGIGSIDFVDCDDLFPDDPNRVQKQIVACGLIASCPSDSEGEPPVVSMTRWISVRLCKPPFPLTRHQEILARESTRAWGTVMVREMQEHFGQR